MEKAKNSYKKAYTKARNMTDGEHKELQLYAIMYLEYLGKLLRIVIVLAGWTVLLGAIQTILLLIK